MTNGVCIERRLVAADAATRRDAMRRHIALYRARRCALIRDYTSIVSVVCARYSTRELGIIFVKLLSAADHVRCATMNRTFISPLNRISPIVSRIQFDGRCPREPFGSRYSLSLDGTIFFEYAWNKVRHIPGSFWLWNERVLTWNIYTYIIHGHTKRV